MLFVGFFFTQLHSFSAAMADVKPGIALTIGNSQYVHWKSLPNAVRGAQLTAQTLKNHGYDCHQKANLSKSGMNDVLTEFCLRIKQRKTYLDPRRPIIVKWDGHGDEFRGDCYFVTTNARVPVQFLSEDCITVLDVIKRIRAAAGDPFQVLVLFDGCRESTFRAGPDRGPGLRGYYIAFSCSAGTTAGDGPTGTASVFTQALCREINRNAQREINILLIAVRNADSEQTSQDSAALTVPMYIVPPAQQPLHAPAAPWAQQFHTGSYDSRAQAPAASTARTTSSHAYERTPQRPKRPAEQMSAADAWTACEDGNDNTPVQKKAQMSAQAPRKKKQCPGPGKGIGEDCIKVLSGKMQESTFNTRYQLKDLQDACCKHRIPRTDVKKAENKGQLTRLLTTHLLTKHPRLKALHTKLSLAP
eukprot:TRINITY_DN4255_c0_g1_i1.p1 TRINITY_DN4255_c0_g1~~TRINITY_DN4255_c0_g1_i1.p1  ORF type:complete len:417 (+),score=39.92 TRINITY_DN4255_c0_g1_i1:57-1307(+)